MEGYESFLKDALKANDSPRDYLNDEVLRKARRNVTMKKSNIRKMSVAAAVAITLVGVSGVTGYAAWRYLHPKEVAQTIEDKKLTDAFESKNAISVNQSKTKNGYRVTLLGMVSGKSLSDYVTKDDKEKLLDDRTYIVTAFSKEDGSTIKDIDECNDFSVSPYIKGENPSKTNIYLMNGGYTAILENGVYYRLVECDDLQVFAKKGVYLGITDKMLNEKDAFEFNENNGNISEKNNYEGINMLFTLPFDERKADEALAKQLLSKWKNMNENISNQVNKENLNKITEKWSSDYIMNNATRVEETVKTFDICEDQEVECNWEVNGVSTSGTMLIKVNQYEVGKLTVCGCSYDSNDKCILETLTKNEDGTFTYAVYVEK